MREIASAYIRKVIDEFSQGNLKPRKLTDDVYMIPSSSELGQFYIVVRVPRRGWVCSCKAYRFASRQDAECQHVDTAKKLKKGAK